MPRNTPPAPLTNDFSHVPMLDGFRGVAVLIVLISHAGLQHLVPGGFGVSLFFFLSGFLMVRLLYAEAAAKGGINTGKFLTRRAVRLLPAMYVFMLGAWGLGALQGHALSGIELLSSLAFLQNYYAIWAYMYAPEQFHFYNTILWSVAIEVHFYLFLALVFPLFFRNPRRFAVLLLGVIALVTLWRYAAVLLDIGGDDYTYRATETRLDAMLYGGLLSVLVALSDAPSVAALLRRLASLPASLAGLFMVLLSLLYREPFFQATWKYLFQSLGLLPIFAGVMFGSNPLLGLARGLLSFQPLRYFGFISFSLYMWHIKVNDLVVWAVLPGETRFVQMLLAIPLSVAVAALSYRYVEKTFATMRRKLGSHVAAGKQ